MEPTIFQDLSTNPKYFGNSATVNLHMVSCFFVHFGDNKTYCLTRRETNDTLCYHCVHMLKYYFGQSDCFWNDNDCLGYKVAQVICCSAILIGCLGLITNSMCLYVLHSGKANVVTTSFKLLLSPLAIIDLLTCAAALLTTILYMLIISKCLKYVVL